MNEEIKINMKFPLLYMMIWIIVCITELINLEVVVIINTFTIVLIYLIIDATKEVKENG